MKFRISFFTFLFSISVNLFSQISITSINSSTVNSCIDSVVQFSAVVSYGGTNPVNYTWSFGDGSGDESGIDMDTINHTFTDGGGYIIRLDVNDGIDSDYFLLNYKIALEPNFSGTNSDREEPICLGQQIFLTGKVNDSTWVYEIPDENIEENPVLTSDANPYTAEFDYRIFTKSQTITSATDIDSIGINLEHSDLSQVKIELSCPNGTSIVLKDFGGASGKFFGNPNGTGSGFDYYWTNTPDNGTMNSIVPAGASLLSGTYTPEQSFILLAGCPLNGDWKINVTDNQSNDSGYVYKTLVIFEPSLLPGKWEFKHTYSSPEWLGSGVSTTSGLGLATAIPVAHGNHRYTFKVKDNFGCRQDTSLINTVEAVTFTTTPDSLTGDFDFLVTFNNTTSWATDFLWDFGDDTETSLEENPSHTYEKEGIFKAIYTAGTDDGCNDTVSVLVTVTVPEYVLDNLPTAFSPNNDLKNDFFKLENGTGIKTLECVIYSRWGKKVAEWNSVEEATETGWDGRTLDGQEASPGVYYYYIKTVGFNDEVKSAKGFIHLFR